MTSNTIRGIKIITGIAKTAHTVDQKFNIDQLNMLLELFNQYPSNDTRGYVEPQKLVLWAYKELYDKDDAETAEYIREVFPWFAPNVDRSLSS